MRRGSARRLACAVVAASVLGAGAALILAPRATAEPLRGTASALPHVAPRIAQGDPLRHLPLSRFTAETLRGVTMLRDAGIDVMLMVAQDSRRLQAEPEAPRFRVARRTIAAQLQVPLVRRYDLMRDWLAKGALTPAELMSPDGLHMADRGYARLAVAVGEQILTLGGQGRGTPGNGSRTAPRS